MSEYQPTVQSSEMQDSRPLSQQREGQQRAPPGAACGRVRSQVGDHDVWDVGRQPAVVRARLQWQGERGVQIPPRLQNRPRR